MFPLPLVPRNELFMYFVKINNFSKPASPKERGEFVINFVEVSDFKRKPAN